MCGGHGIRVDGVCYCEPAWDGSECDLKACSNRGEKINGVCVCEDGFTGDNCEENPVT